MRLNCDHCRDTYDEDNLCECARCEADTCWKCAIHAELPEIAEGSWWCDRCLKDVGREDLLKGKRPKADDAPDRCGKELAVARVLTASGYTLSMELTWTADAAANARLTLALRTLGLSVDEGSLDFEIAPEAMKHEPGSLVLTERGYDRLSQWL